MQLLLCTTIAIGCAAVHVTASSRKGIDEMAVLSKLGGGQFEMIKGLLAKQKAGVPIPGLQRKHRNVEDDPAISMLKTGASRSFATEDTGSSMYGGSSESYSSDSSGSSSGKNWLKWRPPSDDLIPAPTAAVQNANWKPPAESRDEKAVSGLLGMVAGITGKSVRSQAQSQGVEPDQQQPAFVNDLNGLGVTSSDPDELRLEAHSMSWDSIVPVTPIFKSPQAQPDVSFAAASSAKMGKWLGWTPHNDDDEAAAALGPVGDTQQSIPAPAPSQEQKSLLSTSRAVMEANEASTKLGSDLASFDYDTSDAHQQSNSYVESLGSTYKMFAGAIPTSASQPAAASETRSSAAAPDVKQMVEEAAAMPAGVAPSSEVDQLSALKSMNSAQLNVVKSLLVKQQAGLPIPGLTPRKHTDLKALFTGSSMESVMDNLSTGGSSDSISIAPDSGNSYASDSSSYGGSYVGAGAIFQGKKNWLNWRPHDDTDLAGNQMNYRPKDTKNKDENAVNGLLETVSRMTGKTVQRQSVEAQQQQQQSMQPSFVHDLDAAESWALRQDAKQMTWGDIMQPETAPASSLQQPVVDGVKEFENEQAVRQKAKTESWGDLMRLSPMQQNNRPTMSALQQSAPASPAARSSFSAYMSDLGLSSSQPEPVSALQEATSKEKSLENAYLTDLDAPIDGPGAPQELAPSAAPPSNSYLNDLS